MMTTHDSQAVAQNEVYDPVSVPTEAYCQAPPLNWALKIDFENSQVSKIYGPTYGQIYEANMSPPETVSFQTISQFPEVYFDHYRTTFGENHSNLIVSLPRLRGLTTNREAAHAFVISDGNTQALNCTVSYRLPDDDEKALTADLGRLQKEAEIPQLQGPKQVCALEYLNEQTSEYEFGCSATLIGPRDLLTASHCQMIYQNREARARCPGQEPVRIDLEKSARHEQSLKNIWDLRYDVAVLRLTHSLPILPLKLVENTSQARELLFGEGSHCQMYGYGQKVDALAALPLKNLGILHGSQFHFPPEELGGRSLAESNFENNGLIASDPRLFLRPGDSGGPIICQNSSGENVIVGVHSVLLAINSTSNSASIGTTSQWIQSRIAQDLPALAQK